VLGDVLVGYIGAAVHPNGSDQRIAGGSIESLIGYQYCLDAKPPGRAEHKLLYVTRRRICIYPDFQIYPSSGASADENHAGDRLS
jgi:hypothetical protein